MTNLSGHRPDDDPITLCLADDQPGTGIDVPRLADNRDGAVVVDGQVEKFR